MNDTARDYYETSPTDVNGLEELFDAEVLPSSTKDYQVAPTAGVPVQEAAKILGLSIKTVKDRLRKGTLAGFKKRDKYGDTWLVSLSQNGLVIPTEEVQLVKPAKDSQAMEENQTVGVTRDYQVVPGEDDEPVGATKEYQSNPLPDLAVMVELLKQKDHELEGASYRIGYLEAQLEAERTQVKLLTDSLHKPSLWTKFKSWFFGSP